MRRTFLTLAALLVLATPALGSTAHRDAVLGSTDEWLSSVLHVPVADRADLPGADGELGAGTAAVNCSTPGEAHYDPALLDVMAERLSPWFENAWAVALHEHEHMLGGPCVYRPDASLDPDWSFFEEGVVEAVRVDLFSAFFRAEFGRLPEWTPSPMDRYAHNVAAVRALSRLGTGSRTWRDRAARLWRRAALLADWPERQRMIAAANGAGS